MFVRLAAARQLLASHHSAQAPPSGMPQRRRGAAGSAGDEELFRQFLEWRGARRANGGQAQARGAGGAGRGGASAERQPRDGEWQCNAPSCRFRFNFPSRGTCYKCGKPRAGGAKQAQRGGGAERAQPHGPVSAWGTRPLLSAWGAKGRAEADGCPTHRVPGSSLAARGTASSTGAPATQVHALGRGISGSNEFITLAPGGGKGKGKLPTTPVDESGGGTTSVKGTGKGKAPSCEQGLGKPAAKACTEQDCMGGKGASAKGRESWADLAEAEDAEDFDMGDDGGDGGEYDCDDFHDPHDDEHEADVDPETLKQAWLQEVQAVKQMEKQGINESSRALAAARQARDEAKRTWDEAREAPPLATRMQRTQNKLDKAASSLERCRLALEEFEDKVERERGALYDKISEAEARWQKRRDEMDELHEEAGAQAGARRTEKGDDAALRVRDGLRGEIGPELQALAESLDEGSWGRERANLLAARVATLCSQLVQTAAVRHGCQRYDLEAQDREAAHLRDDGPRPYSGTHGTGKGGTDKEACAAWEADGGGRWRKANSSAAKGGGRGSHPSDQGLAGHKSAAAAEANHAPSVRDSGPGSAESLAEEKDEESHQSPPKYRKGQSDEDSQDAQNAALAAKLQAEQAALAQAQAGANLDFGSEETRQLVGQLFSRHVEEVVQRADRMGVKPLTDEGKPLITLGPEQLRDWVKVHLDKDDPEL